MEELVKMTRKYIVYNPGTGENTYADTEQAARELFLQNLVDFAAPYFHDTPYTIADIDDEGVETTYRSSTNWCYSYVQR